MLQLLSASKHDYRQPSQRRIGLKIALIALCLSVVACSNNRMLRPHKIAIQQGNIITQEMVNQLKPGMTKRQVEFVLGTPLIVDTLNNDQWNYIYTLRVASGRVVQKNLNVLFVDGQVSELTGDFKPNDEE